MSGRWFRLYDDLVNDPKVQRLSPKLFKALINLWCLASKNEGQLPPIEDVGYSLRIPYDKAMEIVDILTGLGFFDLQNSGISPHNWDKFQFKSDDGTQRKRAYREKKAKENQGDDPDLSRRCPVLDTDTDTDTEQRETEGANAPAPSNLVSSLKASLEIEKKKASRGTRLPEDWSPKETEGFERGLEYGFTRAEISTMAEDFRLFWLSESRPSAVKKNWDMAFQVWMRREKKVGGVAKKGVVLKGSFRKELPPEPPRPAMTPEEQERRRLQVEEAIKRSINRAAHV